MGHKKIGIIFMKKSQQRKKELDKKRTNWRKKHRILKGKIILWPNKPPEHINARASKTYNWFWKKILLELDQEDIPAIITNIKNQISAEEDPSKIRQYRTMIGMAEDAFQLKKIEGIMDYDTELQLEPKPVYNAEQGLIFRAGKIYTTDYTEDETEILLRDVEGIIVDRLSSGNGKEDLSIEKVRNNTYKNWDYSEKN